MQCGYPCGTGTKRTWWIVETTARDVLNAKLLAGSPQENGHMLGFPITDHRSSQRHRGNIYGKQWDQYLHGTLQAGIEEVVTFLPDRVNRCLRLTKISGNSNRYPRLNSLVNPEDTECYKVNRH